MVVVDTSVWVDWFAGRENAHTGWLRNAVGQDALGLTDLSLCELLRGARDERQAGMLERTVEPFQVLGAAGPDMARLAARHYRHLRGLGHTPRNTIACLIAAFCMREGFALLHRDRDFDAFEVHLGLRVVHP